MPACIKYNIELKVPYLNRVKKDICVVPLTTNIVCFVLLDLSAAFDTIDNGIFLDSLDLVSKM